MLKLIEGGFSSVAHEDIKKAIHRGVTDGKRIFLIVPEQQTVMAEKEMTDFLPPYAPLTFEVTNFTRFANTAFRSLGGIAGEYSDKGREALIMWRALTELSPFLSITGGKPEINTGMVEKALAATAQMQSLAIKPDDLASFALREELKGNERLVSKLSDLAKIISLYKSLLSEKYTDMGDDLYALIKKLDENPDFARDAVFFLEGFTSFTEPQYDLIGKLSERCELTVHLSIAKAREDSFEFGEVKATKERLIKVADKAGVQKKLVKTDGYNEGKAPLLAEIEGLLWRSFGKADLPDEIGETLRIYEAADPYEECDFIAADIKRRVMAGASYRDFAIIARRAEDYCGIIDTALERAHIPVFISKKRDASSFEAIKLIYAALAAVRAGFEAEDVISYAKCGLCGISMEACDEFELYIEKWQINKELFTDEGDWNMSPDGYSQRKSKDASDKLIRLNETKERIMRPLMKLGDNLGQAKTVREHAVALFSFLTDIDLENGIYDRYEKLLALGENTAAEENAGLWKIICASLDSLVETLGDCPIDSTGFENQLKVVISLANIGRIPSFLDEVTVGSADMIRIFDKKHVYLMGVNLGEFPMSPKDTSYFTDRDKVTLSSLGLTMEENSETRYARELFAFSRAFSAATESVTLLYSARSADLSAILPSDIINRISEICDKKVKPIKIETLPPCEKIYTPEGGVEIIDKLPSGLVGDMSELLAEHGYSNDIEISSKSIKNKEMRLSEKTRELLYPGDIPLTQSRIDTYLDCPFSYFLKYDLKLSEDEPAKFDSGNIGSFIHAVLENFFAELADSSEKIGEISAERKEALVRDAAKKYVAEICESAEIKTKRIKAFIDRLCHATAPIIEGFCDEMKDCKFIPRFFELPISSADDENPSPSIFESGTNRRVYVYGTIDRVDTYKKDKDVYVRVIDYKTGTKDFSPSDIDEGRNLQMFLYLKSLVESEDQKFLQRIGLEEGGRLIPSGVIYVKADISDTTVQHAVEEDAMNAMKKKQTRRGMILDDAESIAAMNKDFTPVKFKKDGDPDSRYVKYLYTQEKWEEICEKMSTSVKEVSTRMEEGEISAKPDSASPCSYCKFSPVCRNAKK